MKREKELEDKILEFGDLFFGLNEREKDNALAILEALDFAQSTLCPLEGQSCLYARQDDDR